MPPNVEQPAYYIVSLKHTKASDKYISFWRKNNAGYAWPLSWAGDYSKDAILENPRYYNNGEDTISVPKPLALAISTPPTKGDIDNDAGPVVLNTMKNWNILLAATIVPPLSTPHPKCKGAPNTTKA
jgi:hypothetical protein